MGWAPGKGTPAEGTPWLTPPPPLRGSDVLERPCAAGGGGGTTPPPLWLSASNIGRGRGGVPPRHQQEHRPQRPTERSDPTQHAKGRTGDCPGPRNETTTRRNVTRGGGGEEAARGGHAPLLPEARVAGRQGTLNHADGLRHFGGGMVDWRQQHKQMMGRGVGHQLQIVRLVLVVRRDVQAHHLLEEVLWAARGPGVWWCAGSDAERPGRGADRTVRKAPPSDPRNLHRLPRCTARPTSPPPARERGQTAAPPALKRLTRRGLHKKTRCGLVQGNEAALGPVHAPAPTPSTPLPPMPHRDAPEMGSRGRGGWERGAGCLGQAIAYHRGGGGGRLLALRRDPPPRPQ